MNQRVRMIECEEALARLWAYVDGELPPAEDAEVKRHLEMCSRCYPRYDFQRAYHRFARGVRERDGAPPAFRRRLFRIILEEEAKGGVS